MEQVLTYQSTEIADFINQNSVSKLVNKTLEGVESGDINPLEAFQAFKLFADAFATLNKNDDFKSWVMGEAMKHITSGHNETNPALFHGFKMHFSSSTRTDFSECNDPILNSLEKKLKERKEYLLNLERPVKGKTRTLFPARKFSTKTLVCTKRA